MKEIAQKIIKSEADYVFGLKGSQATLHEDVQLYFEEEHAAYSTDNNTEKDHGRIETRQYFHWCLDVVFREDYRGTRKDNSAENFAIVRRVALNALKKLPLKMSVAGRWRKCLYDCDFMADVLLATVL